MYETAGRPAGTRPPRLQRNPPQDPLLCYVGGPGSLSRPRYLVPHRATCIAFRPHQQPQIQLDLLNDAQLAPAGRRCRMGESVLSLWLCTYITKPT